MISAVAWIPKGAAKAEPEHADIGEDDVDAMRAAAQAEALGESEVGGRRIPKMLAFCICFSHFCNHQAH